MKRISFLLMFMACFSFFLTSCEKDSSNSEILETSKTDVSMIQDVDDKVVIEHIQIIESADHIEDYFLRVGLGASIYKFSKKDENVEKYLQILEESNQNKKPLKVTFDRETQFILNLEIPSVEEVKVWEKNNKDLWKGKKIENVEEVELNDIENLKVSSVSFANYTDISNAFNYLKNNSCDYNSYTTQYGCIPFGFKTDGCYARAHRMRQLLEADYNKTCYKIFVYSNTGLNIPGCSFDWSYHVAPLVYNIQNGVWYVLDPSLSNSPLTRTAWKNIMGYNNVCDTEYHYNNYYMPQNTGCGSHNYYSDNTYGHTYETIWNYQNSYGCASIPQ